MKFVLPIIAAVSLAACAHTHNPPAESNNPNGATQSITHEPPPPPPFPSMTEIAGPKGIKGELNFIAEGAGIHVIGSFSGLKPNSVHGLHVHENGKCDGPKYESAGGHFNPAKTNHGASDSKMRHAGDLGNVTADAKGEAAIDINIPMNPLNDTFGGKSVILHAKTDDLHTNPSGNSGDRVACGLIVTKK